MHPHGTVEYTWHNNLLKLGVFGPFNLQGIELAFSDLKETVRCHKPKIWFRYETLDENTLGSPEVMKIIGQSYKWSLQNGCAYIAVVCANSVQHNLLTKFINESQLNIGAFTSAAEAEQTLNKLQNAC